MELAALVGAGAIGIYGILSNKKTARENFGNTDVAPIPGTQYQYPKPQQFYAGALNRESKRAFAKYNGLDAKSVDPSSVQSLQKYAGPDGFSPQKDIGVNLDASGSQLLAYQLYQEAVNASTPTLAQLNAASGQSQEQTGPNSPLEGGVDDMYPSYAYMGSGKGMNYSSEFQAVNLGNPRAESISACAQNAPTFVATSLLPKPVVPGQNAWSVDAPESILASQSFLAATQQIGVDTVLSSNRNASHDIRGDVVNPIRVVSPFMNTTITPDLERRPLIDFIPGNGLYGSSNLGVGSQYVGQ
jgi:hypothetical protein